LTIFGTMNKKELSVGHYVYAVEYEGGSEDTPNVQKYCYPVRIERIYGDTILDNYGVERGIENDIEEIPLTRDILEQQDCFEKRGDVFGIYDDYFDFELHEQQEGLWIASYHYCEMALPDEQVSICSVSQLQTAIELFAVPLANIKINLEYEYPEEEEDRNDDGVGHWPDGSFMSPTPAARGGSSSIIPIPIP